MTATVHVALDSFTDAPLTGAAARYSAVTFDPAVDHVHGDELAVHRVVVSLRDHMVDGELVPFDVELLPGVTYAVRSGLFAQDYTLGPLTDDSTVVLAAAVVPGTPLTPEQATALAARVTVLEEAGPGGVGGPHAATHTEGGDDEVTLAQSQITGLVSDLAGKASTGHDHDADYATAAQGATADTAVQPAALAAASTADRDRANHTGTQATSTVTGLDAALDAKASTSHNHAAANITSGTLDVARLGSGTPAAGKYVDGDTGAWTTLPTGSGAGIFRVPAARWVMSPGWGAPTNGDVANTTMTHGQMNAVWFPLDHAVTINKLGGAKGGSAAGMTARAGIYADDGRGKPAALIVDAGSLAADGSGSLVWAGLTVNLTPGLYWLVVVAQGSAASYSVRGWGVPSTQRPFPPIVNGDGTNPETIGALNPGWSSSVTTTTGALPGTFGTVVNPAMQFGRVPLLGVWANT